MKKRVMAIAILGGILFPGGAQALSLPDYGIQKESQARVPLTTVLAKLKKSTGFNFLYSASDLADVRVEDSKINYSSLYQALTYLEKNHGLKFKVQNRTVTVRSGATPRRSARVQTRSEENPTAIASFSNATPVSDTLREEAIEEVVVVAYGTQRKSIVTGSISTIDSEEFEGRPVVSTSAALQGLAPGVTVTTQTGSPGGDGGRINIRGINSFGGSDANPLVIIDGVAGNLNDVEPSLIESISVLKDAASAAIYGSRAANGVILITTKRAKENFSVNYRGYVGYQTPTAVPEVTDGLTYMRVFNEASMNDNGSVIYSDEDIARFKEAYHQNPGNYDWQKAILDGSGFTQNHFVSLGAKTGIVSVTPSFGYSEQNGIIRNTDFKRYTFRNNLDIRPSDKLKIALDLSFMNRDRKQIADEGTIWNYLGRMPTNIPVYYDENKYSEGWVKIHPVGYINDGGNRTVNRVELLANLNLTYEPVEWLTLKGMYAPRYVSENVHHFTKSVMTYYEDGSEAGSANTFTDLNESGARYLYHTFQGQATARKRFGGHDFSLMLGASRESYDSKYLSAYRRDFVYDDYEVIDAGANDATKDNRGYRNQWLLVSTFGRFNYNFNQKYLFEANLRYDGSSRFRGDNRWALFPSLSAGWVVSRENFMEPVSDVISFLKLRASWGKLGNQNISSSYYPFSEPLSLGSTSMGGNIYQTIEQTVMSNPNLRWEETEMSGVGVDMSFFRKLNFTFDYYDKTTDGILLRLNTSELTGLGAPVQNAAVVSNKGWELSTNYRDQIGGVDFGVGFHLSDVKNKIIDMKGQASGTLLRNEEGYPINSIYGYIAEGLYQTQEEIDNGPTQIGTLKPGDIRYRDIAGGLDENGNSIPDGRINAEDMVMIGSTVPRYTYGFNFDVGYKGVRLSALFQGVGKVDGYLNSHYVIPTINSSAIKPWQLDYWTPENTDATLPRVSITSTNNTQNSTMWMKSAAYLRLKNVQLGYELPKSFLKQNFIKGAYLYINAQNLFTWTNFYEGYDPEINFNNAATDGVSLGGGNFYPQVKVFSFGVDLNF